MPSTIGEIDKHFAAGAETVTLTRAKWDGIQEISKGYSANHFELRKAQREADRVKRISRPVWRAARIVAEQMRRAMSYAASKNAHVALSKVEDWEMRLRHSMDVSWQDLPANHPKRMIDRRR